MTISAINSADTALPLGSQASPAPKASLPSLVEKPFYFSPTLTVDPKTGNAVLEIRNTSTGAVTATYPNQQDIKAYAQVSLKPEAPAKTDDSATSKAEVAPAAFAATTTKASSIDVVIAATSNATSNQASAKSIVI